jgi:hypothetical protein
VIVLLGAGGGTFRNLATYPVSTNPRSLAAVDLNGDGVLDLVVANFGRSNGTGGSISVLLGNSDGSFQAAMNYPTDANPEGLAVGDFNGDGQPDLAVANQGNSVNIYLGGIVQAATVALTTSVNPARVAQPVNLTATVSPAQTGSVTFYDGKTALGTEPVSNGQATLAVSFSNPGTHLLQAAFNTSTSFVASISAVVPQSVVAPTLPPPITLIASPNPSTFGQAFSLTTTVSPSGSGPPPSGTVTVFDGIFVLGSGLLVNGQTTLTISALSAGTHSLQAFYSGDANYPVSGSTILTHVVQPVRASGFADQTTFAVGKNPYSVVADDFNGDGISDLAVANSGDGSVSVLLGNGDGTFQPATTYAAGTYPYSVATTDFNLDGKMDLVVANNGDDNVSVLLGNGDGTFQKAVNYGVGNAPVSIAIGDFNADGKPDLAVVNQASNNFSVLLGNGNGTFQSAANYAVGSHPSSIAVTDINGDGRPDLVISNDFDGTVTVYLSPFGSPFSSYMVNFGGSGPTGIVVGDVNGDGNVDAAVSNYDGHVRVMLGVGKSLYGIPTSYASDLHPWSLAMADVDGDGKLDLVVVNEGSGAVSVLSGNGDGTFRPAVYFPTGANPTSVAVGDFNGDGRADLAVVNRGDGTVSVLLGK